jgi:hypothetical protein
LGRHPGPAARIGLAGPGGRSGREVSRNVKKKKAVKKGGKKKKAVKKGKRK